MGLRRFPVGITLCWSAMKAVPLFVDARMDHYHLKVHFHIMRLTA